MVRAANDGSWVDGEVRASNEDLLALTVVHLPRGPATVWLVEVTEFELCGPVVLGRVKIRSMIYISG